MPVAVAEKGLKRICPSCGTRYYDFNKRPVVCPSCSTEFSAELKLKARRGRAVANEDEPVAKEAPAEEEAAGNDEDTVSLEEMGDMEEGEADDIDDNIELDDDIDDLDNDIDEDIEDEDAGENEKE